MKQQTKFRILLAFVALMMIAAVAPSTITYLTTYDSIADMVANHNPQGLLKVAYVRGYYTSGDGGGGTFYPVSNITSTNVGTKFKSGIVATYSMVRSIENGGPLNVLWFGAKGNDSASDSAAINAALSFNSATSSEVIIPPGLYYITTTLSMTSHRTLRGVGYAALHSDANNISIVSFALNAQNVHVDNLRFEKESGRTGVNGIALLGGNKRWTIDRCIFTALPGDGIQSLVGDTSQGAISHNWFQSLNNASAPYAHAIRTTNLFSAITINDNWANSCDKFCNLGGGSVGVSGVTFTGNSIEGCGRSTLPGDSTIEVSNATDINGFGNRFEANFTAGDGFNVKLNGISGGSWRGGTIANDISTVLYGYNSIYIAARSGRTDCTYDVGGIYFNNLGTNGYFVWATNMLNVTIGPSTYDLGSGGTALTDAQIAARIIGSSRSLRLSATATLDFGNILTLASADLTITVTGAAVNDSVSLGLPASPTAGVVFNAFVSAADTVTVRAFNDTVSSIDPASATYRATVFK